MEKKGQFDEFPEENKGPQAENTTVNEPETDKVSEELAALKDKYLRLAAEFDNFRKRTAKEKLEIHQSAGKDIILALLEVLDDSERAENQMNESSDIDAIKEGSKLIYAKFRNILNARGLKQIEAIGQEFDTNLHEAITTIPAPSEELKGKVLDEVQKGYLINDTILRYAKVIVGS